MKLCTRCQETKPIDHFGLNKSKSDGRQSQCKECRIVGNRMYYLNNPQHNVARATTRDAKIASNRQLLHDILVSSRCVDCGNSDWRVLEFDHVRGTKIADVTGMLGGSTAKLLEEIDKCQIRCANCHKIVTDERIGAWRTVWV